jgi:hypothetical protein
MWLSEAFSKDGMYVLLLTATTSAMSSNTPFRREFSSLFQSAHLPINPFLP